MARSAYEDLQTSCDMPADKARLKAVEAPYAGEWLNASPLTAIGLRLFDEATCHPHVCICGAMDDARGSTDYGVERVVRDTSDILNLTTLFGER